VNFKIVIKFINLRQRILEGGGHIREYCFTTLFRRQRSDWIICVAVVIQFQKILCTIGVSSSIVVIASWSWDF